jgi:hypothetical protein
VEVKLHSFLASALIVDEW